VDKHRINELDGLRGISILLVIFAHLVFCFAPFRFLGHLDLGQLGVKIFFAISGYVVTTLLLTEKRTKGSIHWVHFLLKRATKLVPTLLLAIGTVALIRPPQCSAIEYIVALTFLTKFFQVQCWHLGHTWSLSVEEVFYVTWAPLVALFNRKTARALAIALILFAPFARCWSYLIQHGQSPLPFSPPGISVIGHFDIIAFGCLVAIAFEGGNRPSASSGKLSTKMAAVFPAMLFLQLPFFAIPSLSFLKYFEVPFGSTCIGLLMAFVLYHLPALSKTSFVARILASEPLAFLGRASYSIYLWQQIPTAQDFLGLGTGPFSYLVRLMLCLGVGSACYLYFEKPLMLKLRNLLGLTPSAIAVPELRKAA